MSAITTHVLDVARGRPAAAMDVVLERAGAEGEWKVLGTGRTDADGRLRNLLPDAVASSAGIYRLTFATRAYFEALGIDSFYPHVAVTFEAVEGEPHYHVPLLISPFGYSTYRGS
jgi:5-hydroxyisourate hydrolase